MKNRGAIRALRKRLGVSRAEFGRRLGRVLMRQLGGHVGDYRALREEQIAAWERGDRSPDALIRRALQVLAEENGLTGTPSDR